MGFLSCNAESAIATCDPQYWDLKKKKTPTVVEFSYADILAATNDFAADNVLGKGSHGSVYKANLQLHGGNLVAAVKTTKGKGSRRQQRSRCTGCGHCTSPAENEIEILSRVSNPNVNPGVVNLIGFATDPNGNKLIVVEYMERGSLHDLLHLQSPVRPVGWARRLRLAHQVAKAVQTLHSSNPPVIHRDIKSSNVLIDNQMNARLADFGLALRGHVEDVRVKCTPPAGTLGYLDPCYLAPEDLSAKSDVFSFGILLLEIISGRNAIDVNYSPPSLLDWALPFIANSDFAGICDRRIGPPSDSAAMRQLALLAARCVRSTAERRPSMGDVAECLKAVRTRIRASPLWSGLRRRVARGERWERDVVRVAKSGSRRNGKVSCVAGAEYECETCNQGDRGVGRRREKPRSILQGQSQSDGGEHSKTAEMLMLMSKLDDKIVEKPLVYNSHRARPHAWESE